MPLWPHLCRWSISIGGMSLRGWLQGTELRTGERPWWTSDNAVALSRPLEDWPATALSPARLALQVPTAVRCIEILTTQIAQFPAQAWRDDVMLEDQPRVLRRPDPFGSYFRFVHATVTDMLFEGTAAWFVTARDDNGRPLTLSVMPACELSIKWQPDMPVALARLNGAREIKYGGAVVDPADVILIPMIGVPGEARGVGPVQAGQPTASGQVAADDLVRSNFFDGVFPTGTLEVPTNLSKKQAEDMQSSFMRQAAGSRAPRVLSGGVEFKPHAVTARDAQWIEARQWGAGEIARLFGVPAGMLNLSSLTGGSVTYNNAVSLRTDLLQNGMSPIIARLEDAFARALPLTQECHLDTTRYLPPLEAVTPQAADPNAPPTDTPATPQTTEGGLPSGNTAVV